MPARVGRGGGALPLPLDVVIPKAWVWEVDAPAEYRLGLGELLADLEYCLVGLAKLAAAGECEIPVDSRLADV